MTDVMNNSNPPAKPRPQEARLRQSGTALPKDVQSHLGRKLRAVYGEMMQEPVPDKFLNLLDQLAKAEGDQAQADLGQSGRAESERKGVGEEP
jgi:hypothetical protein